eukprot:1389966-Pleurochrysis_carterae.AAC.1
MVTGRGGGGWRRGVSRSAVRVSTRRDGGLLGAVVGRDGWMGGTTAQIRSHWCVHAHTHALLLTNAHTHTLLLTNAHTHTFLLTNAHTHTDPRLRCPALAFDFALGPARLLSGATVSSFVSLLQVALEVADAFEKIRINPGNFADGRKTFEEMVYETDEQYFAERDYFVEVHASHAQTTESACADAEV